MTSSTHKQQQRLPNMYGATAAPPPTPSTNRLSTSSDPSSAVDADFLSHLIHRLPPSLVDPPRFKASCTTAASTLLPTIAYPGQDSADPSFLRGLLSACTTSGFFQLTGHPVPKELVLSAELEMASMFSLLPEKKRVCFPRNWPLGYGNGDDEESDATGEFFFLDEACLSYAELELSSLRELMRSLEKVGLEVIGWLSDAIMFDSPVEKDPNRVLSLAWVSKDPSTGTSFSEAYDTSGSGGFYPFVVGLRYQARPKKNILLPDSGPVTVAPLVDSILVTIGDIAQVWSNGGLKKVRGRAVPSSDPDVSGSDTISMTLMLTLPVESTVSPLPRKTPGKGEETGARSKDDCWVFDSFSFEDYAWREYHDRLVSSKDPLDRYRRSRMN